MCWLQFKGSEILTFSYWFLSLHEHLSRTEIYWIYRNILPLKGSIPHINTSHAAWPLPDPGSEGETMEEVKRPKSERKQWRVRKWDDRVQDNKYIFPKSWNTLLVLTQIVWIIASFIVSFFPHHVCFFLSLIHLSYCPPVTVFSTVLCRITYRSFLCLWMTIRETNWGNEYIFIHSSYNIQNIKYFLNCYNNKSLWSFLYFVTFIKSAYKSKVDKENE